MGNIKFSSLNVLINRFLNIYFMCVYVHSIKTVLMTVLYILCIHLCIGIESSQRFVSNCGRPSNEEVNAKSRCPMFTNSPCGKLQLLSI